MRKHEGPCRVCLAKPPMMNSARCSGCTEMALRKRCTDCGTLVSRKSVRCRSCNNSKPLEKPPAYYSLTKKERGYVRIKVRNRFGDHPARNHPRVNKSGYILEHILVMEEKLGRQLLPGENVHHLNGVKSDNRPENLELWVTKQPYGQRPHDLVAWAHEILARYGSAS